MPGSKAAVAPAALKLNVAFSTDLFNAFSVCQVNEWGQGQWQGHKG